VKRLKGVKARNEGTRRNKRIKRPEGARTRNETKKLHTRYICILERQNNKDT